MQFRQSVFALLILAAGFLGVRSQTASATWRVQKYDLNVTVPDSGRALPITATLTVVNVSSAPAGTLTLRISTNADVTSAKINGAAADFSKSEEKASAT